MSICRFFKKIGIAVFNFVFGAASFISKIVMILAAIIVVSAFVYGPQIVEKMVDEELAMRDAAIVEQPVVEVPAPTDVVRNNSLVIPTGKISARFTKKYWLFGTPEIAFKSPVVDGYLSAYGDLEFEIETTNGPSGVVEAVVGMDKAFRSNTSNTYNFIGNGVIGSFNVIQTQTGETVIEDFNIEVNWELVQK